MVVSPVTALSNHIPRASCKQTAPPPTVNVPLPMSPSSSSVSRLVSPCNSGSSGPYTGGIWSPAAADAGPLPNPPNAVIPFILPHGTRTPHHNVSTPMLLNPITSTPVLQQIDNPALQPTPISILRPEDNKELRYNTQKLQILIPPASSAAKRTNSGRHPAPV